MKKKKEILKEVSSFFSNQKRSDYKYVYKDIDDGKSFAEITDFIFKDSSSFRIFCVDWTLETEKKRDFADMLSVTVNTSEWLRWLDKAY